MNKLVKPVELSARDVKRVLAWAQEHGADLINKAEDELVRHAASIAARMVDLRQQIDDYRATYGRILALADQLRTAEIERDAEAIAKTILNRRAERSHEDRKRTVG